MNTLQAIASILKTESVEWIGCFPSNNLIEAVAQEGIRPLMFRQERGALMAADGFSRLNNRKGSASSSPRADRAPRTPWAASPRRTPTTSPSSISPGGAGD